MSLDLSLDHIPLDPVELNARFQHHDARDILVDLLSELEPGKTALTSSFGAEAAVLLHMVSTIDRDLPVLFLNTEMLFPQTLSYQQQLADFLGLRNVQIIRPDAGVVAGGDLNVEFARSHPDACCHLRKVKPLERALEPYDAWITGRKRIDGSVRVNMATFEADRSGRLKINPLSGWSSTKVSDYFETHSLPRHPLVSDGFKSLGCWPCTSRTTQAQPAREGRWAGSSKTECGIHFS